MSKASAYEDVKCTTKQRQRDVMAKETQGGRVKRRTAMQDTARIPRGTMRHLLLLVLASMHEKEAWTIRPR